MTWFHILTVGFLMCIFPHLENNKAFSNPTHTYQQQESPIESNDPSVHEIIKDIVYIVRS